MNVKVVCLVVCMSSLVVVSADNLEEQKAKAIRTIKSTQENIYEIARIARTKTFEELKKLTTEAYDEMYDYALSIMEGTEFDITEHKVSFEKKSYLMCEWIKNNTEYACIDAVAKKTINDTKKFFLSVSSRMQNQKNNVDKEQQKELDVWREEFEKSYSQLEKSGKIAMEEISKTTNPSYISTLVDNFLKAAKETETIVFRLEKTVTDTGADLARAVMKIVSDFKVIVEATKDDAVRSMNNCLHAV